MSPRALLTLTQFRRSMAVVTASGLQYGYIQVDWLGYFVRVQGLERAADAYGGQW